MSTYVPAYKGYIADVPLLWFKRCDGKVFYYDELTQFSFTPETNFNEVNAGWSTTPVAYLPGQSTAEIQATSGQFNADMFAMANAIANGYETDANYTTYKTETLYVASNKVELTETPVANTIFINGLTQDTTAAAGKYSVSGKEITFDSSEFAAGDAVEVSYEYTVSSAKVISVDNKTTAVGELVAKWPVYSSGTDCTEAAIKGYSILRMYRCRVTQMPGFDTSLTKYRLLVW